MADTLRVTVVHAEPARQTVVELSLPRGSTIADALRASKASGGACIDPAVVRVGIFGRLADAATELRDGDRVELYRPLKLDPKEARRRRAAK